MLRITLAILIIFSGSVPLPVLAGALTDDAYTARVLELNKIKPGQNLLYDQGRVVLNRRLIDKNLRTLGKVKDIVLSRDGYLMTIVSEINTTGFRDEAFFDVKSYIVDPTPSSFTVAMDKDQIKESLPKILNSPIAEAKEQPLMLSSFKNAPISKSDEAVVAKVQDVQVNTKTNQVTALLASVVLGKNRGRVIAIPYEEEMVVSTNPVELSITDAQADIIMTLATGR